LLAIFTGFIGPLIVWSTKKEESRFVDFHGREALNFAINILILSAIAAAILTAITVITCGFGGVLFPLMFGIHIYAIVKHVGLMNAASAGQWSGYGAMFQILGPPEGMEVGSRRRSNDDWDDDAAPPSGQPVDSLPAEPRGSLLWLWILGGIALFLVLACVIGGIVLVVLNRTAASTTKFTTIPAPVVFPPPPLELPLPDDVVDRALVLMQMPTGSERTRGATSLAGVKSDHLKRAEVMAALEKQLRDGDRSAREAAARTLVTWVTKNDVPLILELLQGADRGAISDRVRLIEKLGESKDPRAAKALAAALKEGVERSAAAAALKKIGPPAENAVIPILADPSFVIRRAAIDVLKDIGTKKSAAALEPLSKDRSRLVARAAQEALDAIKVRHP